MQNFVFFIEKKISGPQKGYEQFLGTNKWSDQKPELHIALKMLRSCMVLNPAL